MNETNILCYGDSNIFCARSDMRDHTRWSREVRWTAQLQRLLGEKYYVIEEGLSGRTTDHDYSPETETELGHGATKNGLRYLWPCIESHNPLDVVILMLGTNDMKVEFGRSSAEIAASIGNMVDLIRQYAYRNYETKDTPPEILLVNPIRIDTDAPFFTELYRGMFDAASAEKATHLPQELTAVAREKDCYFIDAGAVAQPGDDGIHISEDSHEHLAEAVHGQLLKM